MVVHVVVDVDVDVVVVGFFLFAVMLVSERAVIPGVMR